MQEMQGRFWVNFLVLQYSAVTEKEGGNYHTTPTESLRELSPDKTFHCQYFHINTTICHVTTVIFHMT